MFMPTCTTMFVHQKQSPRGRHAWMPHQNVFPWWSLASDALYLRNHNGHGWCPPQSACSQALHQLEERGPQRRHKSPSMFERSLGQGFWAAYPSGTLLGHTLLRVCWGQLWLTRSCVHQTFLSCKLAQASQSGLRLHACRRRWLQQTWRSHGRRRHQIRWSAPGHRSYCSQLLCEPQRTSVTWFWTSRRSDCQSGEFSCCQHWSPIGRAPLPRAKPWRRLSMIASIATICAEFQRWMCLICQAAKSSKVWEFQVLVSFIEYSKWSRHPKPWRCERTATMINDQRTMSFQLSPRKLLKACLRTHT